MADILKIKNENGVFVSVPAIKGDKGDTGQNGADGYTPVKGVDYFTEEEKAEMVSEVQFDAETTIGDLHTVLDNIIAIQNSYIGGDSV